MVTVSELLEMLPDITIYSGSDGLNKKIQVISFIDSPSTVDWLKGGEVILTTAFLYKENTDMLLKFVEKLIKMGVVALGVKIGRYIDQIPDHIIALANENNFTIFGIGYDTVWSEVFAVFHTLRLNKEKERSTILSADVIAFDKLFRSSSWDSVTIQTNFLKCISVSATIVTTDYEVLSSNNESKELVTIEDYCEKSKNASRNTHSRIKSRGKQGLTIFDYALYPGERLILCADQHDILEHEIDWIVALYKSIRTKNEFMQDIPTLWKKFITECLIGNSVENVTDYIRILNLREITIGVVLIFSGAMSSAASDEFKRLQRVALSLNKTVVHSAEIEGGDIVMMYGKTLHQTDSYCFIKDLRGMLQNVSNQCLSCKIRVGSVVNRPEDIKKSCEDAKTAVRLNDLLYPEDNLIFYRDICIFDNLAKCNIDLSEISYLSKNITAYDACKTLEIYLESGNIKKAAEHSFIHDNTMRYRLQKVEECLNMDLNKPLSRICLLFKIKLRQIADQVNHGKAAD